jgi:acyl-CoA synthetase (AMP-forming)/AMP-acid ligase II
MPSVNALVDSHANDAPDRLAFDMPSLREGRLRLTYRALRERTRGFAAGLYRCGARSGDRIAVLAEGAGYAECVIAYLALLRLGAIMVPINPRYVDEEIGHALSLAECVGIVASAMFVPRIDQLPPAESLGLRVSIEDEVGAGWTAWSAVMGEPVGDDLFVADSGTPANILFTSGTTGKPKGVIHTHGTALACGAIYATSLTLDGADIYHHPIPFCTSSGTQFTLMASLWAGSTLVTEAEFRAAEVLARMRDLGTTVFLGVPSHLLFLLDEVQRAGGAEFPNLRMWNYGGAVMPREAIEALRSGFPNVEQSQNYGMTETGPTGAFLAPQHIDSRPGSTGRPMPLCEIRIVGASGHTMEAGISGEICIRSPACMVGYYGNPTATEETLRDGWIRTGDVGHVDEDGFLFYTDRQKDIINRGGLKVSSVEVEEVIYRFSEVLEAAVIAVPHARLGEDVAAFVVPRPGIELDRKGLDRLLGTSLASFKVPREIHVVSALPRNAMGKVLKAELRRSVAEGGMPAALAR